MGNSIIVNDSTSVNTKNYSLSLRKYWSLCCLLWAIQSITDIGAACRAGRLIVKGVGGAYCTSVSCDVGICTSVAAVGV